MEYVFGTNSYTCVETLRTKGDEHTELTGFQQTVREYDDAVITDTFLVLGKTQSSEDTEGNCYDWYEIDKHSQTIDKTKTLNQRMDAVIVAALEG